jgi:hypothetical protein
MKNFLTLFGGIFIILILIILIASKTVDGNFNYETTVIFDVNKELLWDIINDVDAYYQDKYGIINIEKKEYQGNILISWREDYNFGISKDYEILTKKDPEILILKIKNNFTNMVSTVTFKLFEDDNKTYLNVVEESELNNIFYRGLKVLSGKESYVNSQIKWIRVGLYNYLIAK